MSAPESPARGDTESTSQSMYIPGKGKKGKFDSNICSRELVISDVPESKRLTNDESVNTTGAKQRADGEREGGGGEERVKVRGKKSKEAFAE